MRKVMFLSMVFLVAMALLGACGPVEVPPEKVIITRDAFIPATLNIKMGTMVIWVNNDLVPHQIKSISFNSPKLDKGKSYTFTFTLPGTYEYSQVLDTEVVGKIIVE